MPQYDVLTDVWTVDARGHRNRHAAGQTIEVATTEAEYLLLAGQIRPLGSYVPPSLSPIADGDLIILHRNGSERVLTLAELPAFFAPVLGGGTGPVTPPPASAAPSIAALLALGAI